MNWDRLAGGWKRIKGMTKERWGRLTHDPRNIIAGKRDQMMGKVQEAYGLCKQKAAGN